MAEPVTLACLDCGQKNRLPADRLAAGPKCAVCGAALVTGKVAELDMDRLKAGIGDGVPLIVDFWAPWCGPCRTMVPEFSKAAGLLKGRARFAKIDTERFAQASQRFGIRGIPLLILFHKGRELARLTGARPAGDIAQFVQQHLTTSA